MYKSIKRYIAKIIITRTNHFIIPVCYILLHTCWISSGKNQLMRLACLFCNLQKKFPVTTECMIALQNSDFPAISKAFQVFALDLSLGRKSSVGNHQF